MKRYIAAVLLLNCFLHGFSQGKGPQIGTYPPQVHQQICQESTFTRYLDVFNSGDTIQVRFDFNSAGLPINNYYADLVINSNDPDEPVHTVLAMLHVQILTIYLESESDSICYGCSTKLNVITFGCSEEYSYNWTSEPPGFFSTEKSPVVSPKVNTTYTVTVTDGNYSSQKSLDIQVYGSADISENLISSQISIFPNPTCDRFTIKFDSENEGQGNVKLCDISGRVIFIREIELKKGTVEYGINPGNLNPGIYFLSLEIEKSANKDVLFRSKLMIN